MRLKQIIIIAALSIAPILSFFLPTPLVRIVHFLEWVLVLVIALGILYRIRNSILENEEFRRECAEYKKIRQSVIRVQTNVVILVLVGLTIVAAGWPILAVVFLFCLLGDIMVYGSYEEELKKEK